jgi:membrane associated rhomboid family serine protease
MSRKTGNLTAGSASSTIIGSALYVAHWAIQEVCKLVFLIIPYHVDVPYERRPFANWLILGLMVAVFLQHSFSIKYGFETTYQQQSEKSQGDSGGSAQQQGGEEKVEIKHPLSPWILHGWNIQGLIGHMWLHNGILHLLGNMLFLWLFGNAVCAKVGNKWFPLMYLGFGFAAAATHLLFEGGPAMGASGAINGVVGMFLVFFPENDTSAVFTLFFMYWKRFSISSYWLILLWFVFDIWGAMTSIDNVGYFAHLGGFAAGFVLAVFMLERKWVTMEDYEKSLLQLVGLHKKESRFDREYLDPNFAYLQEQAQEAAATAPGSDVAPSLTADWPMQEVSTEPPPVKQQPAEVAAQPRVEVKPEFVKILCSCGKKVKFPARYAGRTGRCPQCGRAIAIPQASEGAAAESAMQSSAADGMIRFSCKCGKKIKVPSKYSGKTGKCPQCHARVIIP